MQNLQGLHVFLRKLAGARRAGDLQESQGIIRFYAFCEAHISLRAPGAKMQDLHGFIGPFATIGRRPPHARISRITRN